MRFKRRPIALFLTLTFTSQNTRIATGTEPSLATSPNLIAVTFLRSLANSHAITDVTRFAACQIKRVSSIRKTNAFLELLMGIPRVDMRFNDAVRLGKE
jgi:hypothetical protein